MHDAYKASDPSYHLSMTIPISSVKNLRFICDTLHPLKHGLSSPKISILRIQYFVTLLTMSFRTNIFTTARFFLPLLLATCPVQASHQREEEDLPHLDRIDLIKEVATYCQQGNPLCLRSSLSDEKRHVKLFTYLKNMAKAHRYPKITLAQALGFIPSHKPWDIINPIDTNIATRHLTLHDSSNLVEDLVQSPCYTDYSQTHTACKIAGCQIGISCLLLWMQYRTSQSHNTYIDALQSCKVSHNMNLKTNLLSLATIFLQCHFVSHSFSEELVRLMYHNKNFPKDIKTWPYIAQVLAQFLSFSEYTPNFFHVLVLSFLQVDRKWSSRSWSLQAFSIPMTVLNTGIQYCHYRKCTDKLDKLASPLTETAAVFDEAAQTVLVEIKQRQKLINMLQDNNLHRIMGVAPLPTDIEALILRYVCDDEEKKHYDEVIKEEGDQEKGSLMPRMLTLSLPKVGVGLFFLLSIKRIMWR